MSSKISALPAATQFSVTDVLDCLSSGANKKLTRDILLAALSGENIILQNDLAQVAVGATGNILLEVETGEPFIATDAGGTWLIQADASGNLDIQTSTGNDLTVTGGAGNEIVLHSSGAIELNTAGGTSVDATYAPFGANWAGSAPGDIASAVDRIANLLGGGGATPIP